MLPSSPRDKVNTPKTPKIRGFQIFKAEFAVYLPFIAQKIVVVPCGSCGAAAFFLPKNQRRTSQERNTRRSCYAVLFALYAVLSAFSRNSVIIPLYLSSIKTRQSGAQAILWLFFNHADNKTVKRLFFAVYHRHGHGLIIFIPQQVNDI